MPIDGVGYNSLNQSSFLIQQSSERIASGRRINSAQDDAAGLAISNRLSSQIAEFSQAARNANDGVSFLQTAEGGLENVQSGLDRIRELALQASNGILGSSDRQALNQEAQQLKDEISATVDTTRFNGRSVLANDDNVSIQLGQSSSVDVSVDNLSSALDDLAFDSLDLSTVEGAQQALGLVDGASEQVLGSASSIGAQLNRLDSSINALFSNEINAAESRSRVEDADIAKESTELSSAQIRRDASIALLAQANEQDKNVLALLGL